MHNLFFVIFFQFLATFFLSSIFGGRQDGTVDKLVRAVVLFLLLLAMGVVSGAFGILGSVIGWLVTILILVNIFRYEFSTSILFVLCLGIVNQIILYMLS